MRNMILKTIFASILGSLLISPVAHADRQGGGTMRAAIDLPAERFFKNGSEFVRYHSRSGNQIVFDYEISDGSSNSLQRLTLNKTELSQHAVDLIRALNESKKTLAWAKLEI